MHTHGSENNCRSTQLLEILAQDALTQVHSPTRGRMIMKILGKSERNLFDVSLIDVVPVLKALSGESRWITGPPETHIMTGTTNGNATPLPPGKWMSPREEELYHACNGEFRSAEDICARAESSCDHEARFILRNLVKREILESSSAKGYRKKTT